MDTAEDKKIEQMKMIGIAAFIGTAIAFIIGFLIPSNSKKTETLKEVKNPIPVIYPIKKDEEFKLKYTPVAATPSSFLKYRVVMNVELGEETDVDTALVDFKKVCSLVSSSPKIKNLEVCEILGINDKDQEFKLNCD